MKTRSVKKTRSIKRKRTPRQSAEHRAAVQGMLNIAGKLNGSAEKVATKPSWKAWFTAAMTTGRDEYLVRSYHERLAAGDYSVGGPYMTKATMIRCAIEVAADREKTDAKDIKITKKTAAVMAKHGKKPDEDWPEGEAAPEDVQALWTEGWNRRAELAADVLREVGEGELADAILADPDAFWTWKRKADEIGNELLPKDWKDADMDAFMADSEKRYQAVWTDHFPKTGKDQ